jgi:cell wall assembly regulator SMI1
LQRVATSWRTIDSILKEHAHSAYEALRPPASIKQIDRLQRVLGTALPRDLLNSLQIHDGMPVRSAPRQVFINYMTLLPCAEIASDWKLLWELQRECDFGGDQVTRIRKIKNDAHWRSGWIPIMDFEEDKVVLDLDAGAGGKCGQIIRWYNNGSRPMHVLAESYAAWLAQVAEELSHRRFTLDEWGGIHLRKRLA